MLENGRGKPATRSERQACDRQHDDILAWQQQCYRVYCKVSSMLLPVGCPLSTATRMKLIRPASCRSAAGPRPVGCKSTSGSNQQVLQRSLECLRSNGSNGDPLGQIWESGYLGKSYICCRIFPNSQISRFDQSSRNPTISTTKTTEATVALV